MGKIEILTTVKKGCLTECNEGNGEGENCGNQCAVHCSAGTNDNSPRFQPRVGRANTQSPGGTAGNSTRRSLPSLRDLGRAAVAPGAETPGYFREVPAGLGDRLSHYGLSALQKDPGDA